MALDVNLLRKPASGSVYHSDVTICVAADGSLVEETDTAARWQLVAAGCEIEAALAKQYGLIGEPASNKARKDIEDKGGAPEEPSADSGSDDLESKSFKELQAIAAGKGLKSVGVSKAALVESIRAAE